MKHWVSCARFTVLVVTDERGIIRDAAPIVRKFVGQRIDALLVWARGLGGLKTETWK